MSAKQPPPKYILLHHTKRVGHWLGWRILHLFFPGVVHFLTDKYQDRHHHLVIDTLYAVTAITLVAVNVALGVWWTKIFTPVDLTLEVHLSESIKANGPMDVDVLLQNGDESIQGVSLVVVFPAGIEPTKPSHWEHTQGTNEHELELAVGDLRVHELQRVIVPAWVYGNVGDQQKIRVFVRYHHFQHAWELAQGASFELVSSNFTFTPNIPEHLLNDQPFEWTIDYHNLSKQPIPTLQFELTTPGDLTTSSVDGGEYSPETQRITVTDVPAESSGTLTVHSVFHEVFDSNQQISVSALVAGHSDQFFSQGTESVGTDALRPRVSVSVTPNKTAVNLGETLYYTINLDNIGDAELSQFIITADLQGEAFNTSRAYGAGAVHSGSTLTWTLDEIIAPGDSTQLRFSVPTNASLTDHNLTVQVVVNAQAVISEIQIKTISQTVIIQVKFNSNLSLTTSALYTGPSGEQFGYGPWPVQADNITAVRIFWSIKNINNQVNSTVITTTLPGQVEWTGNYSVSYGSGLSYNSLTREVSWNVGSLPADGRTLGVSFEVRVLPNYLQIGKIIRLTNETNLTAVDSFTGSHLARQASPVFTSDPVAAAE